MATITVSDYVQAHDVLDAMHHCLIDWHLWAEEKAPGASGPPLLRAACSIPRPCTALRISAAVLVPAMVPAEEGEAP